MNSSDKLQSATAMEQSGSTDATLPILIKDVFSLYFLQLTLDLISEGYRAVGLQYLEQNCFSCINDYLLIETFKVNMLPAVGNGYLDPNQEIKLLLPKKSEEGSQIHSELKIYTPLSLSSHLGIKLDLSNQPKAQAEKTIDDFRDRLIKDYRNPNFRYSFLPCENCYHYSLVRSLGIKDLESLIDSFQKYERATDEKGKTAAEYLKNLVKQIAEEKFPDREKRPSTEMECAGVDESVSPPKSNRTT